MRELHIEHKAFTYNSHTETHIETHVEMYIEIEIAIRTSTHWASRKEVHKGILERIWPCGNHEAHWGARRCVGFMKHMDAQACTHTLHVRTGARTAHGSTQASKGRGTHGRMHMSHEL